MKFIQNDTGNIDSIQRRRIMDKGPMLLYSFRAWETSGKPTPRVRLDSNPDWRRGTENPVPSFGSFSEKDRSW
jgi:hypothetical protein